MGDPKGNHAQIIREFGVPDGTVAAAVFAVLRSCLSAAPAPPPTTTGFVADDARMGANEVLVYHTLTGEGPARLRRCRTEITDGGAW
ncbi:MAG: hypothetical protein FJX74_15990 [Armatimonadetes bacterium]|nr:hypothetical protein [Armatimonadota bacterium]